MVVYGHGGFRGRRVACVGNRVRLPEKALICEIGRVGRFNVKDRGDL
jgi:hypothetical protein